MTCAIVKGSQRSFFIARAIVKGVQMILLMAHAMLQ